MKEYLYNIRHNMQKAGYDEITIRYTLWLTSLADCKATFRFF